MFNRNVGLRSLALSLGAFVFSTITWAAGAEISGFGGGITLDGGGGTHGIYGGTGAFRLGDHVHLFGEFSLTTLATQPFSSTLSSGATVTGTASAKLANFGGGADYSFGSSESRLRPYVSGELGVGHFYGTGSASASGVSTNVSVGVANSLYAGVGGGVRLYIGKRWGIKPEIRYQRYQSSFVQGNSLLYTVGLFYQFGE